MTISDGSQPLAIETSRLVNKSSLQNLIPTNLTSQYIRNKLVFASKRSFQSFVARYVEIQRDLFYILRDLTKSNHMSAKSGEFWQFSAIFDMFQPYPSSPSLTDYQPTPTEVGLARTNSSYWSTTGLDFGDLKWLGQFRVGHRPDPWTTLLR